MGVNYWIYSQEVEGKMGVLDKGEPVEIEIMDQEDKLWKRARVLLSREPTEGSTPIGLLGPFGEPHAEGQYHLKILEVFSEMGED